ncbi:hypothetical protein N8Z10_00795 [bacterium]|nr:hypothetical protein [bacterium]
MPIEKRTNLFGDDVAKIAKAIKADIVADKIAKSLGYEDCGCEGRKEKLNNPDLLINKVFYKNKDKDGQ